MTDEPVKRRLFLHIGQSKTGTKAIQHFLDHNRKVLAGIDYLVPRSIGRFRHTPLSFYSKSESEMKAAPAWNKLPYTSASDLRRSVEQDLVAEISNSACSNIVLSDEALFGAGPENIHSIIDCLREYVSQVSIVVYLRRQDDQALSRYKQTMREGKTHTLLDFIANKRNKYVWQYGERLKDIANKIRDSQLIVRPYDKNIFLNKNIIHDFCSLIGISAGNYNFIYRNKIYNKSMDAVTTEYARRYNLKYGRADADLLSALTQLSDGPDLKLSDKAHEAFWDSFKEGNAFLVKEFMPEVGEIFLNPSRSRSGITQDMVTSDDLVLITRRLPKKYSYIQFS